MIPPDLFVGGVAILGGLFCWMAAAQNYEWCFRFWAARLVEGRWGRGYARLFYVGLGSVLIALGITIASGWRFATESAEAGADASLRSAGASPRTAATVIAIATRHCGPGA